MGPVFTHILGWTNGAEVRNLALSLGERAASVASQVRGCLVMSAHLIPPCRASDPSPGPRPDEVNRDRGPPSPPWERAKTQFRPLLLGKGAEDRGGPAVSSERCGARSAWMRRGAGVVARRRMAIASPTYLLTVTARCIFVGSTDH